MKILTSNAWRKSAPWMTLAVLSIFVLVTRLQLSFDLSAFFPQQSNLTHDILLEQLRNGPGSRLLVIGIKGGSHDQLAEFSDRLRQELSANVEFSVVLNGEFSEDVAAVPEPINSYYLLLANVDYSRAALQNALESRFRDLAFAGGDALLKLVARDPFLVTLDILERLMPVDMTGDMWFAKDGSAVLMAETRSAAIDLMAQTKAVDTVKKAFSSVGSSLDNSSPFRLEVTGVGAFGVELQRTIRAEAKKRTILAMGALFLVLLVVYRSPRLLLLATMPIGMGFLVGLALVSLVFENVHGITLAFGFTLMGIAIDYPLHLFSHARHRPASDAIIRIWPTMRLGAISTAIAYLALSLSGSEGLAQLGVFTAGGVAVAVLATRSWLPFLMAENQRSPVNKHAERSRPTLQLVPAIVVLGLALITVSKGLERGLWDDNLSSLSPVPEHRLQTDISLRSAAGTPDMRYQLMLHDSSLESLLRESESLEIFLEQAVQDGLLTGWQTVTQLLPSRQLQQKRQDAIPDKNTLRSRLSEIVADTPFNAEAFAPFEANAGKAKELPTLLPSHLAGTPLQSWLDSHLVNLGDQWVSLISISRPQVAALRERVNDWDSNVELVDLRQSSVNLMRNYRYGTIKTFSVAALIIIALLSFARKQPAQIFWIALTVSTALAATIASVTILHGSLTVIHLVALLLVLGLGLDYALFLSREETESERQATNQAVLACAASTTLAFGMLAGSSIPVLRFLGLTVAAGSVASYVLAFSGSQLFSKKVS
jgi:predicted exporter